MNEITSEAVISALQSVRVPAQPEEADLHALIARALTEAGIEYAHEYKLAPRCRLDFLCGTVAIEIKKGRPPVSRLREQLARYLAHPLLTEMIVVVQKNAPLPPRIEGKPVRVVRLNQLWGVALP